MTATATLAAPPAKTESHTLTAALFGMCMFTTGASGLVNEYVLATTTTYILGNSIEQFSIIIAIMLLAMGVAGAVQKYVGDAHLFEKFVAIEVLMALLGGFAPLALYATYGSLSDHFNLVLYSLVGGIGFLIGFEIPLVMRIIDRLGIDLRANLAIVYAMDYIGAFVGAVVWVKFLLKDFPLTEISFIVAGTNFLVAVVTVIYLARRNFSGYYRIAVFVAIAATALALAYGYTHNRSWNVLLEQKLYEDPIVVAETTRYQHLVVTRNPVLDEYRLYINGNTQFSSADEAIYHEQLVHPVMSLVPDHRRILILGGGDGLALREILKYPDVDSVTLVDLDPDMIRLAATNPIMRKLNRDSFSDARVSTGPSPGVSEGGFKSVFRETGRFSKKGRAVTEKVATVQIINIDADRFLSGVAGSYNVIIVDLPDPNSIELAKLYSTQFYGKLRKRLSEHGMLVVQSTSPYHAKAAYLAIGRTLRAVGLQTLPYHDNVPSFGDWGWYLSWKSSETEDALRARIDGIRNFPVETRYLSPDVFRKGLVFGKDWLTTSRDDVNTLMQPTLLRYYLDESWKNE